MPEKSLYRRARISPLAKYHLNAGVRALHDAGCVVPNGSELAFIDQCDEPRKLVLVKGEWMEYEVVG